jgi:hypothetical protein
MTPSWSDVTFPDLRESMFISSIRIRSPQPTGASLRFHKRSHAELLKFHQTRILLPPYYSLFAHSSSFFEMVHSYS